MTGDTRFERFLAALDRLTRGVQPTAFDHIPSRDPLLAQVAVMTYRDYPKPAYLVGHTYGLSLATHPDWSGTGGRELVVGVRSTDPAWPLAAGRVAEALRGVSPFAPGHTFDFGEPLAPDTTMSAYVAYTPALADPADAFIDLGDPEHPDRAGTDVVELVGLYALHSVELQYIAEHGIDRFWALPWDPFDVGRAPAV